MNLKSVTLAAAVALTAATAAVPAFAQPYGDDSYRGDDRGTYSDDSAYGDDRYDDRSDDRYGDRRSDGRYGDDRYRDDSGYAYRYENGRYDRRSYDRYDRRGQSDRCRDNRVAGTVLGAIAGGVIGSNVDNRGSRNDGAAIGAVVGGLAGNSIARSSSACDAYGNYYGYNQTYPWRSDYAYGRGYRGRDRSDWGRRGCRMAVISSGGYDRGSYVTVCPDRYGRYRVR